MATFPVGWPPRPSSGVRSLRFFVSGTATANYFDNAFLFKDANLAQAQIGQTLNGRVIVNVSTPVGTGGNAFAIQVVIPAGGPHALSAALSPTNAKLLVVSLATDGSGFLIPASNTATLVAAAIGGVAGFAALATGTGADSLQFAEPATLFFFGGAMPIFPTPDVHPGGATTNAFVGDRRAGGSPMGGGMSPSNVVLAQPLLLQPDTQIMHFSKNIRVRSTAAAVVKISFDGINQHGEVGNNSECIYRERFEAGIAIQGTGTFTVEAW